MSNLFKNVACFTDLHAGLKSHERRHNDDCEDYIRWFIEEAKKRDCETCIFLGDFHHHRSTINVSTLNYTVSIMRMLDAAFEKVYMITGNHDLFYREKREINSLVMGEEFKNIVIVDEQLTEGDVTISPWLVGNEWKEIEKCKSKYMFGHFEIPGFYLNAKVEMADHGEIQRAHFKNQDYVFSGHFHKRQSSNNIHYIGNPFAHNFSDAWDNDRGAMFLSWGGTPEYVNWLDGPKYITCTLSELLSNTEAYLLPKTYAKVTLDIDVTYEEANFLRDTLSNSYDIRDFKLIESRESLEELDFSGEINFQTIDEIVAEQLMALDTNAFDKNKLLSIYNGL